MNAAQAFLESRGSTHLDDFVLGVAWAPDSRRLAVLGGEGRVFAVGFDGEALAARAVGEHMLGGCALSWQPKSTRFATSGQDGAIALWDAESGGELKRWRPATAWSDALAFSPGGAWLASSAGKVVSVWNAEGELLQRFEPLPAAVNALGWDRPGRDLAAATHGGMHVFRVEPPRFTRREYRWDATCLTVAFSPNGKVLATGMHDGSVHFWYLATGRDSQMRGYPGKVALTAWSSNSRLLATPAANDVVIWDFGGRGPEGTRPIQLQGHTDRIEALQFQPAGQYLVTGGRDWRVSLWQPGRSEQPLDAQLADSEVTALQWSPDGRHVAVGERSGRLSVYEVVHA